MLKEVIVVEGKSDIQQIAKAVEADCIATEGFTLRKGVLEQIQVAYEKKVLLFLPTLTGRANKFVVFWPKNFRMRNMRLFLVIWQRLMTISGLNRLRRKLFVKRWVNCIRSRLSLRKNLPCRIW